MGAQLYCFILLAVRRPPPLFLPEVSANLFAETSGKNSLCTSSRRLWQASFVGFRVLQL